MGILFALPFGVILFIFRPTPGGLLLLRHLLAGGAALGTPCILERGLFFLVSRVRGGLLRGISFSPEWLFLSFLFFVCLLSPLTRMLCTVCLYSLRVLPLLSVAVCLFCSSFVSWAASPHKAPLSFGGGRVELLVWVALFRPRCCCSSLVFVVCVFSCCLLFFFPLLCSLSDFWICGVSSSDLACVLLFLFLYSVGSLFRMSFI